MIGGSDCNDGFCYISVESSTCSDKWDGFDPNAYYLEDYWHQGSTTDDKLFKSKVACENKKISNTGYSLSEALILASINPKYDELNEKFSKRKLQLYLR